MDETNNGEILTFPSSGFFQGQMDTKKISCQFVSWTFKLDLDLLYEFGILICRGPIIAT